MGSREALAAAAVALPFVLGAAASEGAETVFRFEDPAIVESSGLAVRDGLVVTVNDSGDEARVFVVDPVDGRTVGVTRWSGGAVDVEALAPAGPGEVWVGDIGDNAAERETVRVVRVPVGRGERSVAGQAHDLLLPDGPADAEALLVHPRTGRLHLVTKDVFGGRMYAAPADLGPGPQRLRLLGGVTPLVTDGAFFPDGRHVVLRDYSRAVVLSFPALREVGSVPLPPARQGEGIAVVPGNRLLVSSEGVHAPVHEVALPAELADVVAGRPADPPPTARDVVEPPDEPPQPVRRSPWTWLLGGVIGVAMVVVLLRSLRPR